jgi:hypothetical protein
MQISRRWKRKYEASSMTLSCGAFPGERIPVRMGFAPPAGVRRHCTWISKIGFPIRQGPGKADENACYPQNDGSADGSATRSEQVVIPSPMWLRFPRWSSYFRRSRTP